MKRIALIGLRGAGKSTLGAQLAKALGVPFVELDREIEREAGTSLSEIFLLYGRQGYRRYERRSLEKVLEKNDRAVIATGGSIVSEPGTYDLLLSSCFTVWLKAAPEEHMARVIAQGDTRPMAGNDQAMEDLRRILEGRAMLYRQADVVVDTAGQVRSKRAWPSCARPSARLTAKEEQIMSAVLEPQPSPALVTYDTHPERYAHWQLSFDGPVATLSMDVDEDKGLKPGYKLKLNSYDLGVDIELHDALNASASSIPR